MGGENSRRESRVGACLVGKEQQGGQRSYSGGDAEPGERMKQQDWLVPSGGTGSVLSRAIWKHGQTAVQFELKMRKLVGNY